MQVLFEYITTGTFAYNNIQQAAIIVKNIIKKIYGVSTWLKFHTWVKKWQLKICQMRANQKIIFYAYSNTSIPTTMQQLPGARNKRLSLMTKTTPPILSTRKGFKSCSSTSWACWWGSLTTGLPPFCSSASPSWARGSCKKIGQHSFLSCATTCSRQILHKTPSVHLRR